MPILGASPLYIYIAIARANKSGWITEELFLDWFDHFLKHVQPKARQQPTLLLADGHVSHTNNLTLLEKARENNVMLLIFPSHCTHKLQSLDVAIFKSLKWNYDKEVTTWLRNHPGRIVSEGDIAELFAIAYGRAATTANACSGFQATGINPFNANLFSDEDFVASEVTNISLNEQADVAENLDEQLADVSVTGQPLSADQPAGLLCL